MLRFGVLFSFLLFVSALALAQTDAGGPPAAATAPVPAPARKMRISTAVMLGQVEHKTMPVYPEEAMKKGIQGDATFKVEVDETGKLTAVTLIDGDPLLVTASTDSLRTFHFRPFVLDGTPVKVEGELGFHFTLAKAEEAVNGHVECMTAIPKRP
jgi:TonB family protein